MASRHTYRRSSYNPYNIYHRLDRIQHQQYRAYKQMSRNQEKIDREIKSLQGKISQMKKDIESLSLSRNIQNIIPMVACNPRDKSMMISIDGNLGSGKSSLLNRLGKVTFPILGKPQIFPEPVEMWKTFKGMNLLVSFLSHNKHK